MNEPVLLGELTLCKLRRVRSLSEKKSEIDLSLDADIMLTTRDADISKLTYHSVVAS